MKTSELRGKSPDELKDIILASKKEQFNLRMQAATGEAANGNRVRELRRTIARVKTLMTEPKAGAKQASAKKAKKG